MFEVSKFFQIQKTKKGLVPVGGKGLKKDFRNSRENTFLYDYDNYPKYYENLEGTLIFYCLIISFYVVLRFFHSLEKYNISIYSMP